MTRVAGYCLDREAVPVGAGSRRRATASGGNRSGMALVMSALARKVSGLACMAKLRDREPLGHAVR